MTNRTFDDFNEFANDYRKVHTDNIKLSGADSFYFAEMKVKLLMNSEPDQPAKVLDLGCGDGTTELFMMQYFPGWQVTGIDTSEKSIEAAESKNIASAVFKTYNGYEIPFSDNLFDVIFIAGVLHHVNFSLHNKLLQEMFRVMKPGGRFYLFEHNPLNPLTRHLVNTCVFDKDAKLLKSNYSIKLLKDSGLKTKKKEFIIFFPRKGFLSKFIFLEKYLKWLPLGGQYFIRAYKPL